MADAYTLSRVISSIPFTLLREYLATYDIGNDINWKTNATDGYKPIIAAINNATKSKKDKIDDELRDIHRHASNGFIETLIDSGNMLDPPVSLMVEYSAMSDYYERCLWTLIKYPSLYRSSLRFNDADGLKFHKRRVPAVENPPGKDEFNALKAALSEESIARGRGKGVKIEEYQRGDSRYFFCLLEDAARKDQHFDERSRFKVSIRRPAYELIFDYNPVENTLRTYVKGGTTLRRKVDKIFGETMLGSELPPEDEGRYDLSRFIRTGSMLELEPDDLIENVILTSIRFDYKDIPGQNIIFNAGNSATQTQIDQLVNDIFGNRKFDDILEVGKVNLRVVFRPSKGKRKTAKSFYITPDSCSLGDDRRDEILLDLLKRWNIDVFATDDNNTPETSTSVQRVLQLR